MLGFSNLLKSNFGDSATPTPSPLEPRLKNGQDAATTPSPVYFNTPIGERRVPRDKDPKKPNYEMIKDAREGMLSGFLRLGKLFRASDFVGIVNPKTAIITLNEIYDFQTRCLPAINDQPISRPTMSSVIPFKKTADEGADDEKTLRNLFYISLNHDELPSFHFWTKLGDLDPVKAGERTDWGKLFVKNPPSPATTAKIAVLENARKERVQHRGKEQQETQVGPPLEFLDRYNDINLPGLDRRPTQVQPAGDVDLIPRVSASQNLAQSPLEAEVLLHFNRGGMYLRELTHKALYAMACWLVKNEEEEEEEEEDDSNDEEDEAREGPKKNRDMFLDILEPGKQVRQEKIVSVSRASNRTFQENIKPFLAKPENKFRVRSTRYQCWWNSDSGFDASGVGNLKYDLKLVRPNIGYCYCSANWDITKNSSLNSRRFEKALEFLFDWELSAYPNARHLDLDIPGHGSFDLNRDSGVVVDAKIQKIFAELSSSSVKSESCPTEIFIRDIVDEDTEGSELIDASPPKHGNAKYGNSPGDVPDVHPPISGAAQFGSQGFTTPSNMHYQPPSDNIGSLITSQSDGNTLTEAIEIRGGPDLPSIHPRLLTVSEINRLHERLKIAEASIDETDDLQERLRIAEEKLSEMNGLKERLKASEDRARLKSSCPFCSQDWAGVTKQQQQDHLKLHQKSIVHQPDTQKCLHPDCMLWLGEGQEKSTYEAIAEHLRSHIEEEHAEDGICVHQCCHTNMYALTGDQQEEHESMHRDGAKLREERDQLLEKVGDLEDTVMKCDRLQEQVTRLQDAADERDRLQENLIHATQAHDSLQSRVVELERRLQAASVPKKRLQSKELEPETEVDENPKHAGQPEAPKKLRYCNICLKSVDKMSANAKAKHADKCQTSVSEFLLFNPAEAKIEREKRSNGRAAVKPRVQEGPEEGVEVPSTGKKRKQKAKAKIASLESQQDETGGKKPVEQPEASKSTGRKTLKRKNDTFKPSNEDESEDGEFESARKKPKLKAKEAKNIKESAPTRRSTRFEDVYQPPSEEENDEMEVEEADREPSSSAKGGKRKRTAAETRVTKKAKTKK